MLPSSIFSFSQNIFHTLPKTNVNLSFKFILSSANAFNLDQSKKMSVDKELKTTILPDHGPSTLTQSVAYRTGEQEVAASITSSANNFFYLRLMTVIATGFIPLSLLTIVSTIVMWESSQWPGKNIVRSAGLKKTQGKHG